jgi:acyl-CoA synthetase (AMP-forming)/AMP-acid ligase II
VSDASITPVAPPDDLWRLIESAARTWPDGTLAVDEHDRVLTFGECRDRSERVAAGLVGLGVGAGDAVSWQLPTRLEAIVLVGALARLGVVQNPCLPIYRERELRVALDGVRPRLLVVSGPWRGVDHPAMAQRVVDEVAATSGLACSVLVADPDLPEGDPAVLPAIAPAPEPGAAPVRWVFFTSGTTAEPKGARHTDASIGVGGAAIANRLELTPRDRYPIVFPFTHIGGMGMLVAQLLSGAGAIAIEQYDPATSLEVFARHGLTVAAGGTPMAMLYLQAQRTRPGTRLFPDLRMVLTGAAPTPPTLDAELRDELGGIGSLPVYGLTEGPFATVASVHDPAAWRATTEGRMADGCEVRIVAPDDPERRALPPDTTGEICFRGPVLCRGYLDRARTAEAFDAGGYFHTGDLGSVDAHGNLRVTGRLKDVIIRKGENIVAKDVEDVLYEHPDVVDVAVIGLPDDERGERACAVVVLRDGAAPLDVATVTAHCRAAGLQPQKIPEQVEIVDVLPRNAGGKILKYQLQETYS